MKHRISFAAVALAAFTVVISGCQAFHVKTPDEIKAEVRTKMIEDMRAKGQSEEEINRTLAFIDMPYKKQLETSIRSSSSPVENVIRLMSQSHRDCEFKRSMVSLPAVSSYDISNRKHEVATCAFDAKSVVSGYFGNNIKYKEGLADKSEITDIYIKWLSYMDALSQGNSSVVADSLGSEYKSSSRKYEIKNNLW
ncbi:hypothetical protein V0R52_04380 [Pseudomonas asiatica]|uniref:hypothetical protein n=1 Tax=Pseudomonas asiatica TaxID=2219225 RepID=UPI002E7C1E01|nr:hypothetical protein [Pseudomonas asiatica]MEE1915628.1 hypothetical protein [Pseudomonas asiatica]